MPPLVQLAIALAGLARELFKYYRESETANKVCAVQIQGVTDAVKVARQSKDTSALESAFAGLGLAKL